MYATLFIFIHNIYNRHMIKPDYTLYMQMFINFSSYGRVNVSIVNQAKCPHIKRAINKRHLIQTVSPQHSQ